MSYWFLPCQKGMGQTRVSSYPIMRQSRCSLSDSASPVRGNRGRKFPRNLRSGPDGDRSLTRKTNISLWLLGLSQ